MVKAKTRFFCQQCGHEELRWVGRCPGCNAWNSMVEEHVPGTSPGRGPRGGGRAGDGQQASKPRLLTEIGIGKELRFSTGSRELDRVLGGGIVPGSLVLVGGDPGIGKSTLLLQVAGAVSRLAGDTGAVSPLPVGSGAVRGSIGADGSGLMGTTGCGSPGSINGGQNRPVIYVSGEESDRQIGLRAQRLGVGGGNLFVLAETNLSSIDAYLTALQPSIMIIDSIQTIYLDGLSSAPGSIGQVRECTGHLLRMAKESGTTIFLVGHVTKEGSIAGPRVLEHMVDTVLYFEGERNNTFRVLRAVKNRFGSTNEIGIFEMGDGGLKEVANPSELFMSQRPKGEAGSVVTVSMEGTRPVLVEIQALVTPTAFGMPRRLTTGVDFNRVVLIAAVLEKRVNLRLGNQDIYVNAAGGVKLAEPAIDLGIALALASSFRDRPLDPGLAVMGEIGLTGEIRAVSQLNQRVKEAGKLGFGRCLVPAFGAVKLREPGVKIISVESVFQAVIEAFGGV